MSKLIAAYGGGFKPPTKGHFEVVQKALKDFPKIDEFIIYVGSGEREGINQAQSILIWEIYQTYLPMKVKIEPSKAPIGDIIRLGKNNLQDEVYFVIGAREGFEGDMKDIESRTKNIEEKYPNMKIQVIQTADQGISGTNARKASQVSYEDFTKYIPTELSDKEKEEVYNIVKPSISEVLNENASYSTDIDVKGKIMQLTQHMLDKGYNIEPLPKVEFVDGDSNNAREFFGKTAYYNPNNHTITLFTEGRHPKDIVRSFAHEMMHHIQNLEGRLSNITTTNTQEDDNLNDIEAEANLKGTMTFRNWTDSLNEIQTPAKEEDVNPKELKIGIEVEMEHTDSQAKAKVIALQHLAEDPKYYTKLKSLGLEEKKNKDPFGLNQYARELAQGLEEAIVDGKLYPFKVTDRTYDEGDNSLITTEYKFTTPNNTYRVEFYSGEYNPESKTFDLSFGVDKGELNTIDTFQMTGEGNARKILKTILDIVEDFINKEDVEKIVIDGTDEKRKRIYKTIFSSSPSKISDKIELKEAIVGDKIECDNCDWSWDIKDGGDDLYTCHKCWHDNTPKKLNEGRYDKSANQFSKIVFEFFKDVHDRGDKKGEFELSVGPDDNDAIKSNQFEFDLAGVVEITDDEYSVDGGANAGFDREGEEITPLLSVSFKIPKNPDWQKVSFDIKDVVRHELEHLTQDGGNVRPSKSMEDDQLIRDLIDADLLPKAQYFKLEKEVDAMLQGLYFKAKKSKSPFKDVVNDYLNIFVDQNTITLEEKEDILNTWRTRRKALSLPLFENKEQVMKYEIYSDMDGVLTDFDKAFMEVSGGIFPSEYEKNFGKDGFWKLIDAEGADFWEKMPWMSDGKTYWDYIKEYNPILLSSPSRSSTSRLGKRLWVKNNLPGTKLILAQAKDKQNYAQKDRILIDDRPSNIEQWRASGGVGILHISASDTIKQLKELGI